MTAPRSTIYRVLTFALIFGLAHFSVPTRVMAEHPFKSIVAAAKEFFQQAMAAQANEEDAKKANDKEKEDPLVKAICALNFDRRNESLIKQWSEALLPKPEEDEKQDDAEKQDQEAKPTSAVQLPAGVVLPQGVEVAGSHGADGANQPVPPEIKEKAEAFQKWVVLGHWDEVGNFIAELNEKKKEDAEKVYDHLLNGLLNPQAGGGANAGGQQVRGPDGSVHVIHGGGGNRPASNIMTPEDLAGIVLASPWEFNDERLTKLGRLLGLVRQHAHLIDGLVEQLDRGLGKLGGDAGQPRQHVARLMLNSHELELAQRFLPDWQDESIRNDAYAVELLADYHDMAYKADRKVATLTKSWEIHQQLATLKDVKPDALRKALSRLVTMSTQVDKEVGQAWLEESFAGDAERGVRLLTIFGTQTAENLQRHLRNSDRRLESLRMQQMAGEALVKVLGDDAHKWRPVLTRMAETWVREAELANQHTRDQSSRMQMQWDNFGNMYYINQEEMMNRYGHHDNNQPRPIPIRQLLEIRPTQGWLKCIDDSLRPSFSLWIARLHLKANEEVEAFPHIEQVARTQPKVARELVHTFLRKWQRNHDPNSVRRQYNPYMYIYGYNSRSESIPLTRSKQERNLAELKKWVKQIRALPIEPIDETYLASAFSTCHSSAEVYKLSAFEEVFGEIGALEPETVAQLANTMRTNLASVWRKVKTQEELKTKRNEKEVQAEVLRGYDVALEVVAQALERHASDWQLQLVHAALAFDKNEYEQTVAKSSQFSARRRECYKLFQQAATAYAQEVPELDKTEQTPEVYCTWFYAALGSSELGYVSHEQVAEIDEFAKIRAAIDALTPSARDHHLGEFANTLFERMSNAQPQVKFRYIRGGMQIAGDHSRAREAQRSLDYYSDIVHEIELQMRIDGSDNVGHEEPFGVFVSLVHTSEMERESGGFEKYAQNQNAGSYYYNYGRPSENYRDKFQEAATQALEEHFEVLSVTFESPKQMRSRPVTGRDGWRETPYAYMLIKPRGPEIDMLPAVKLDLDFLDATGYVVIPIQSASIPINASGDPVDLRPIDNLEIVQTLDERLADEGKLVLEIKATATGLIPELEQMLDVSFANLEVASLDDQGVSPSEFDAESDEIRISADRSWVLELVSASDGSKSGRDFSFCSLVDSAAGDVTYQRYDDADLVACEPNIQLASAFGDAQDGRGVAVLAVSISIPILLLAVWWQYKRNQGSSSEVTGYTMPQEVNPFTVLSLLEQVKQDQDAGSPAYLEVEEAMAELQSHYFAPGNGKAPPDLERLAERWVVG